MKKFILLYIMSLTTINYPTNMCFEPASKITGKKGLGRTGYQQASCNCNCAQYPISKHEDGHKCSHCHHRVLPWDINKANKYNFDHTVDPIFIHLLDATNANKNPFKQKKLMTHSRLQKGNRKPNTQLVLLDGSHL